MVSLFKGLMIAAMAALLWAGSGPGGVAAQVPVAQGATPIPPGLGQTEEVTAPNPVEVTPLARDDEIATRLTDILRATEWFSAPEVTVREGVVFLNGRTKDEQYRAWAGNLAEKTRDVVAVVNRIEVVPDSPWNLAPLAAESRQIARGILLVLPKLVMAALILLATALAVRLTIRLGGRLVAGSTRNPLIRDVGGKIIALPVLLLGLYLVLQALGLTRLALTVLGGTGIAGLVVGIAFSDIAENFLASVLISTQRPFRTGDVIEVAGKLGVVERVTTRGTLLMGFDGNHIQIPNATIYKNIIVNYTANPNRRIDFTVGIGYENSIAEAQELILRVLHAHPAVLSEPEVLVLAEKLEQSSVLLHIYLWFDGSRHNILKVKSAVIRLTKRALQDEGFSMPDAAREVIFPLGVPLVTLPEGAASASPGAPPVAIPRPAPHETGPAPLATAAEGRPESEAAELQAQARRARAPEEGANLLED